MAHSRRIFGAAAGTGLVIVTAAVAVGAARSGGTVIPAGLRPAGETQVLLALTPVVRGETATNSAPVPRLSHPPEMPEDSRLVVGRRFWTSDSGIDATYRALSARVPTGMTRSGSAVTGTIGGPLSERDVTFDPRHLPGAIASAELILAVVRDGTRSAVGAYAEVVPRPPRLEAETVPLSVRTVTLTSVTGLPSHVVARRTISGARARQFVRDFDALKVVPPGVTSCPTMMGNEIHARLSADGHVWQVTYPSCPGLAVSRDGHPLDDLVTSTAMARDFTRVLHVPPAPR